MPTIQDYRNLGFSEEQIGQWASEERQKYSTLGFTTKQIDDHLTGIELPDKPPKPFLDRITEPGQRPTSPTAEGEEEANFGERLGRAMAETGVQLFDMVVGAANPKAYLEGVEGIVNPPQLEEQKTGRPLTPEEVEAQVPDRRALAQFGLMHIIPHTGMLGRTAVAPNGAPYTEPIGGLPTHMDFVDAATVIARDPVAPAVERKLLEAYTEHGVHPSEAAADASRDPWWRKKWSRLIPACPSAMQGSHR
jgi:hypothetical protein